MNKSKIKYFLLIFAFIITSGALFFWKQTTAKSSQIYLGNKNYSLQIGMQDLYLTSSADVVMLGNSLTYNVNWSELLNRKNIVNRGIISDITQGYLHRLDYVYKLKPKLCFIEGGINDLYANFQVEAIFENYVEIIKELKKHNIIPVIQSTICVANYYPEAAEKNIQVAELNSKLSEYARVNNIDYIDIKSLVTNNNYLMNKFTYDGLHLNAGGYKLWKPLVEKVLIKYKL
jgi:lysophospholipase L1-like esterase